MAEAGRAAEDLGPGRQHEAPEHAPVPIVADGKARATIAVMGSGGEARKIAVKELKSGLSEGDGGGAESRPG